MTEKLASAVFAVKPAIPSGLHRLQSEKKPNLVTPRSADFWLRAQGRFVGLAFALLVGVGLPGCVTYLPLDEYNIARAAMEGARDKEAMKFAPNLWFKAEQAYREGEAAYRDRRFDKARVMFEQARKLAEDAENAAHLSRFESGEIAP